MTLSIRNLDAPLGAEVSVVFKGAHVVRTHDVRACVEAMKLADLVVT